MAESCCEKVALKEELVAQTEKLKILKQEYQKLLIENLQKDLIIRQQKLEENREKFKLFENHLSKTCIETLNGIGESQRDDSHFVSVVLFELYNGDLATIKKLSLSGRGKGGNKTELNPEKRDILAKVFAERLSHISQIDESRKNNLNKLIRNAIDKVNRK